MTSLALRLGETMVLLIWSIRELFLRRVATQDVV